MLPSLQDIIELLEISDRTESFIKPWVSLYEGGEIPQIEDEIDQLGEIGQNETHELRAVGYLFLACISSDEGNQQQALEISREAICEFQVENGTRSVNEALIYWLCGKFCLCEGDIRSAIDEFDNSIKILNYCIEFLPPYANQKREHYEGIIQQVLTQSEYAPENRETKAKMSIFQKARNGFEKHVVSKIWGPNPEAEKAPTVEDAPLRGSFTTSSQEIAKENFNILEEVVETPSIKVLKDSPPKQPPPLPSGNHPKVSSSTNLESPLRIIEEIDETPSIKGLKDSLPEQLPPLPPGNPPKAASSTNSESPLRIIIPIDKKILKDCGPDCDEENFDIYEKLKYYNKLDDKSSHQTWPSSGKSPNVKSNNRKDEPTLRHPEIPPFTIYNSLGGVRAGTKGEIILDDIGRFPAIDGSLQTTYNEINYYINFIVKKQKTISQKQDYGWLEVLGNSMNNAIPIPIEDHDYVLFWKNQEPDYCKGKIVIAQLLGQPDNISRLVIKRLVKISGKTPYSKSFKQEIVRYILHSESEDKDPDTSQDIEIFEDSQLQLIGEVVAVAKHRKI